MKLCRICACAVAVLCILCSGCTEHISANDIENIQPMTKREFELAYTEKLSSQLYNKYMEYINNGNVVTYAIQRGNNSVSGAFYTLDDKKIILSDNNYYFKYKNKWYIVNEELVEDNTYNFDSAVLIEGIVKNLNKTCITEISNNVEIHKSSDSVDDILRHSSFNSGGRSEITITFLKNFIHVELYDVTVKQKTIVNLSFSLPDGKQHGIADTIKIFLESEMSEVS